MTSAPPAAGGKVFLGALALVALEFDLRKERQLEARGVYKGPAADH